MGLTAMHHLGDDDSLVDGLLQSLQQVLDKVLRRDRPVPPGLHEGLVAEIHQRRVSYVDDDDVASPDGHWLVLVPVGFEAG